MDKLDWSYASVSSDAIRKEYMDKLIEEKGCTRDEAFEKSAKPATLEYTRRATTLIKYSATGNTKNVHVIFLDKNHPLNGLPRAVQLID